VTAEATPPPPRRSRAWRWGLGLVLTMMVALGLVLLFLLAQATGNRELYERNYTRLLVLNIAVATLLLAVIVLVAVRLVTRLRRGKFGSRLLIKLAAIFALVGFVPGMLIYVVSYQFVSRSIESWFDVKVEGALDAGLSLGRTTLDTLSTELTAKVRVATTQLGDVSDGASPLALERLREQLSASDVTLWTASGQLIASAGQSRLLLNPERPPAAQLRAARAQRSVTQVEGLDETSGQGALGAVTNSRIRVLALVTQSSLGLLGEPRFLQVIQPLPPALVANALAVTEANREYQERALARQGLRRMYIGTLTLSLFLSVFGAILLAVLLGNQLARPLLVLAEGVRQVAAGDLTPKAALATRDELGGLTRSFAQMTQQLADARSAVDESMREVNAARAELQTILDNLTAGVVVMDAQGHVLTGNPGAAHILRAPLEAYRDRPLADVPGLADFAGAVAGRFAEFLGDRSPDGPDHWQQSFELHGSTSSTGDQNAVYLIARGAQLPGDLRLLVLDDISEVVSAQRAQAWGEVARRLAHEIKNPLTPIQLSAERLAMKLAGKVAAPEQAILDKSVRTIIDQVDAMKRLVNEFRDYARLPAAELRPLDLNQLVADVLQLYGEETAAVPVTSEPDPTCPPIMGDAHQLRQVIHNLLQNAQDATEGCARREVTIRTQWNDTTRRVRLVVRDSGPGFAEHILKRAFEPYVTTKARGTGLGLAVVKKIADEHGARIELGNRVTDGVVSGAQVSLSFAVAS
jgi:nitrogen fixation/metabolism regulation signal transduction histidine kinase